MLYKNMKGMVHFPDGDTDFIDIVAGDKLARYIRSLSAFYSTSKVNRSDKILKKRPDAGDIHQKL